MKTIAFYLIDIPLAFFAGLLGIIAESEPEQLRPPD
jgi:hypothetical protein